MADLDLEALEEIMKVFLNKILIFNSSKKKSWLSRASQHRPCSNNNPQKRSEMINRDLALDLTVIGKRRSTISIIIRGDIPTVRAHLQGKGGEERSERRKKKAMKMEQVLL
jgi:hypothetical protein